MPPAVLVSRLATTILIALTVPYLVLVAYPGYAGGFDDPASRGRYGVSPIRRPVPFYGDETPFSTPSPTADRAPLAMVAGLIWVGLAFLFIPLSAVVAIMAFMFSSDFHPAERAFHLAAVAIIVAIQVITFGAASGLVGWMID